MSKEKLQIFSAEKISGEFIEAHPAGGSLTTQTCHMCERLHFCLPEGDGTYEEGEFENLLELSKKNPDKYRLRSEPSIPYIVVNDLLYVLDCPCNGATRYEKLYLKEQEHIIRFFKNNKKKADSLADGLADL